MEQQEVPAGWWDSDADRSLLAGVFKHGGFSVRILLWFKDRLSSCGGGLRFSV